MFTPPKIRRLIRSRLTHANETANRNYLPRFLLREDNSTVAWMEPQVLDRPFDVNEPSIRAIQYFDKLPSALAGGPDPAVPSNGNLVSPCR